MDPPADCIGLQPEKLEEEKEGGPLFHCDLCDADIIYKIAQEFLPGLASACIDNTTGGLFKTPATVAVDIRREMVDYLVQRSENFVTESVVLEGGPDMEATLDPYDSISDFVDDFVSSKRNFFSRISGWLLSEKREDWIDDLVQQMELNGFWLLNRRITVAQTILRNLDLKNMYHCNMNFKSLEDLEKHKSSCSFRTVSCVNEGCDSSFSAAQMDQHDSICAFKMLQCEQNCPDIIMRRDMDRHCITICPMKLMKCPFYSAGCQSTVPKCTVEQHRSESLSCHLLYVLQVVHKEASEENLKERAQELEKLSSPGRLESARDARSLTYAIKDLEAKLGPLKVKTNAEDDEEDKDWVDKKEVKTDKPLKDVRFEELPSEKETTVYSNGSDYEDLSPRKGELTENAPSQTNEKEAVTSVFMQGNLKESPVQREEVIGSPAKVDEQMVKSLKEEAVEPITEESSTSIIKENKLRELVVEKESILNQQLSRVKILIESPPGEALSSAIKTVNSEMSIDSPPGEVSSSVSTTVKREISTELPPEEERFESINSEVGKESAPGKEEKDSLNSAGLRAEDVKN